MNSRVLKECRTETGPVIAYIYNASLAQGPVPDDWRQANVAPYTRKEKSLTPQITDPCRSHAYFARPWSI